MKYIIMAGGNYKKFETPKQLLKVNGEVIIERTIRLLRENGLTDIAISTNNPAFDYLDVEKLRDENNQFNYWGSEETKKSQKSWLRAYYPINEPVCYIHGDVYFSDKAIKTIVETKVKDTMFFCTWDKWDGYKSILSSGGREPFAYKVENYKLFRDAIDDLLRMIDNGDFKGFPPCAWTAYRYINGLDIGLNAKWYGDLNSIFNTKGDYIVINDYTNDVDDIKDVAKIEEKLKLGGEIMVRCEVINQNVTIREFERLKNIKRIKSNDEIEQFNYFEVGDTFETDEDMASYLKGEKPNQPIVCIKVLEVIPEPIVEKKIIKEEKPTEIKKVAKPITKKSKKVK